MNIYNSLPDKGLSKSACSRQSVGTHSMTYESSWSNLVIWLADIGLVVNRVSLHLQFIGLGCASGLKLVPYSDFHWWIRQSRKSSSVMLGQFSCSHYLPHPLHHIFLHAFTVVSKYNYTVHHQWYKVHQSLIFFFFLLIQYCHWQLSHFFSQSLSYSFSTK